MITFDWIALSNKAMKGSEISLNSIIHNRHSSLIYMEETLLLLMTDLIV